MKKRRITSLLTNQKGSSILQFAIGLVIFTTLVAFLLDVVMLNYKRIMVSRLNQDIVRAVRTQGGLSSSKPVSFSGSDSSYETTSELVSEINSLKAKLGLKNLTVQITGTNVAGGSCNGQLTTSYSCSYKYMSPVTITTSFEVPWYFNVGGAMTHKQTVKNTVVSEYKNLTAGETWEVLN